LGYIQVHTGRLTDGILHYRKALELQPAANEIRNNLAYALIRSGAISEAIEQYQTILRDDPGFVAVRRNLEQLQASEEKKHPPSRPEKGD
jgi:Flp pilus assembly protein TadD